MTYLDTGCLVKLYYPEPESAKLAALVAGKQLIHTPLHDLEIVNALQLKFFHQTATAAQVGAARALIEADLKSGVLRAPDADWKQLFAEATELANQYTGRIGSRSLDILHCAAAKVMAAGEFITTDGRQQQLARAMALNLVTL